MKAIKKGGFIGLFFALMENRKDIWNLLNGNEVAVSDLLIDTLLLVLGGILGYYIFKRWLN